MPEVYFTIQLPDGKTQECYSPSTVICQHFKKGDEMPIQEFVTRSRVALTEASERVRAKFGFGCGSAHSQIEAIHQLTHEYPLDGKVRILSM